MPKGPLPKVPSLTREIILLLLFLFVWARQTSAISKTSYYDFGPYYNQPQVLGLSFSSLEELPAPTVPQNILPPPATGIIPGSLLYPLELLTENIQLTITFNPLKREELRLQIASERLSETKTLIEQKQYDLATDAASNYKQTMETVAENIEALKKNNTSGASNLVEKLEDNASAHAVVAQSLTLTSPPVVVNIWIKVTNATETTMDHAADISGKPPIPEDLSNSLQELKEEGLLTPEQSDKLYDLDSRRQVREELEKLVNAGQFPIAEVVKLNEVISTSYPEIYKQTLNTFQFAELRSYQTLPPPSEEIATKIQEWQKEENVPPPSEIRPYLYTARAEELAKNIDFASFTQEQQNEVAGFYPQAVAKNPSFTLSPTPPSGATPSPEETSAVSASPSSATPETPPIPQAPTTIPPTPPSAAPYLTAQVGALPGNPTYFLKTIGEQLSLVTSFDPTRRAHREMRYAEERLREANAISGNKDKAKLYAATLKRYQDTLERASNTIKNFKGSEEDKKELAQTLQVEAARHNLVFEKGLIPPPGEKSTLYTEVIRATENAMDRSADALGSPALPAGLTSRLQDLKAQGLLLPEEVEQLAKADSREEAREKIRKLMDSGTFPPADAKKLDEAQALASPQDYNQLVEVRKVEELQRLRAVQSEFAQTTTLRQTNAGYEQRIDYLLNTIDPRIIKPEDLAGREELLKTYRNIVENVGKRPINAGQFGKDVIPGFTPSLTPTPQDAVLTTCPLGAIFKQFEGCVWEDTGRKINDYDQYRCESPREYWSFASKKCLPADNTPGVREDTSPLCPVGYTWSWEIQSCQTSTGGLISPSPQPEPTPATEKELEERLKSCPQGSSYKIPQGCVWDESGKPVYDQEQYRCTATGQYYSFKEFKCIEAPKPGEPYTDDAQPTCPDPQSIWSWSKRQCVPFAQPTAVPQPTGLILREGGPNAPIILPGSPFYFLKRGFESFQNTVAFTDQAKQEARLAQARERFAEGYDLLQKNDEKGFKKVLGEYTQRMQEIYNDMPKIEKLSNESQKALGENLANQATQENLLLQKARVLASADLATPITAAESITIQGLDRAADLQGEPPLPNDLKEKIEALPEGMIKSEDKEKLLQAENRVEARIRLGSLLSTGILSQDDTAFLDKGILEADPQEIIKLEELQKLSEVTLLQEKNTEIKEKVEKAEKISKKLEEFQKTFEVGKEVPADIRPFVRLTRIEEIVQTIRPDIVNLNDFGNRKDIQLAVAALKEEFKPTKESLKKLEDYRRTNPGKPLPLELARIEALSFRLGVREAATACFLPSPPFSPNTPCPPPGAAIPIASYYSSSSGSGFGGFGQGGNYYPVGGDVLFGPGGPGAPSTDENGKPFVYGQGPKSTGTGTCPDGHHWMYDSGGWCMSNSGTYGPSYNSSYSPTGPGYTPYSPYYNAPGAPPVNPAYPVTSYSPYAAPSYYGLAPTYYSTNPPPGTVPGTGPKPTSPGQCPSGFHWMPPSSNQPGWCMADASTYVPSGPYTSYPAGTATSGTPPPEGYNCGSQPYDPVTKKCKDGACPGGFNWDGSKCVSGGTYYSPNLTQSSCGPGYYWDGRGCIPTYTGSGGSYSTYPSSPYYSGSSGSSCTPPSSGCGSNSYWDYGTCSCRSASSYTGGSGPSPGNYCQGLSCGSGYYLDYQSCSCKSNYSGSTSGPSAGCSNYPSGGCGTNAWFDWSSCSCQTSTSSTSYSSGYNTSTGACTQQTCGSNQWFDWGTCSCRPTGDTYTPSSGTTSTSGSTTSSGGSSSGSCPSGYHWMSDNGGWCMADGATGSTTTTTTTTTTTESSPPPSTTESTSTPPPSTETTPPPSEPAPTSSP